jgi:hypothetical protein
MGKKAETKTETQAGQAVAQDGSVALTALPCRRLSAGFASPESELGGTRGSSVLCYQKISFCGRGKKLLDRPKPFLNMHLRRATDPDWRGGALREPQRGDSGSKRRARGRGFGFEFGRWLATSTERVHSRSPCGVRTRDECTKRSGRPGWTIEHTVRPGGSGVIKTARARELGCGVFPAPALPFAACGGISSTRGEYFTQALNEACWGALGN